MSDQLIRVKKDYKNIFLNITKPYYGITNETVKTKVCL